MIEEVIIKLPEPLKLIHHNREVMINRHDRIAECWWYRVGTLVVSNPGSGGELRFSLKVGLHEVFGGLTTTDQVTFVRDRNRSLITKLSIRSESLRAYTKKAKEEIAYLDNLLKGKKL